MMQRFFTDQQEKIAGVVVRHNSKLIATLLNKKLDGFQQKMTSALMSCEHRYKNKNCFQTSGLWLEFETYGLLFTFVETWLPTPYFSDDYDYAGNIDYDLCVLLCDENTHVETNMIDEGLLIMEHLLKHLNFCNDEVNEFLRLRSKDEKTIRREIVSDFFEPNDVTTSLFQQCRDDVLRNTFDIDDILTE